MLVGFFPAGMPGNLVNVVRASPDSSIDFDIRVDATGLGPWMFDIDATPYAFNLGYAVYAYTQLVWNPLGIGDGSSGSGGSGQASTGNCTAENTTVQDGIAGVTMEFDNYTLAGLQKKNWGVLGQSGDHRNYTGGIGTIKVNEVTKLKIINSRISMDVDWPAPVGPGSHISGSGWGTIDVANSDPAWVTELDNGIGQVEFVFSSFSPVVQTSWGAFSGHVTVRGASHQENLEAIPINSTGSVNFTQSGISLNVNSFTNGGAQQDQNLFLVKKVMTDPGGAPPVGISQVISYCYWEMSTVLDAINTSVTFDISSVPGIISPANLRILNREDATKPWVIYPDQELVDTTHIRANNVTSFGQFGLGVIPEVPPTVTTEDATNITTSSAMLGGNLTSLGTATSANVSFQWGTSSGNYTGETTPVSMNTTGAFSFALGDLSANTTYYFRAKAVGDGIGYGDEKSFTTASTYLQEDFSTPQLGPSWQVIETVPGLGRYSLTDNPGYLRYYLEGSLAYGGGWSNGYQIEQWRPSLTLIRPFDGENWVLRTRVNYNLLAHIGGNSQSNSTGAQYQDFYIAFGEGINDYLNIYRYVDWWYSANSLTMELVSNNVSVAHFDGAPSPIGDDGWVRETYWYEITRIGREITVRFSNDGINYTTAFSALLTEPVTTTQRAIIDMGLYNGAGSYVDWDYIHANTLPHRLPPTVTTDNATGITANSAILNGTLTSLGTASSANVSFEWGTESGNYTDETPSVSINATGAFSANLTGLIPGMTYYFRAKAMDDDTSYGANMSFTTLPLTPVIAPASIYVKAW